MKSNNGKLLQIKEVLEEISQLDKLIAMHEKAQDQLMVKQYTALKRKYFNELVNLVLIYSPSTELPPSFILEKLFRRFYPESFTNAKVEPALENMLMPYF